jgi:arylsulfatase A-like enzyme
VEGRSLAPVLRGDSTRGEELVIGCFTDTQRMIRTDRWKLIWYPKLDREQLFDITNDPDELQDRSEEAVLLPLRRDLQTKLGRWLRDHADPMVTGED